MRKVQKHDLAWAQAATALTRKLRETELSTSEIARASGVDYHAVRRMRLDGVSNHTRNAALLCGFFGILQRQEEGDGAALDELIRAVQIAWDGTEDHALLLRRLLEAGAGFRVVSK